MNDIKKWQMYELNERRDVEKGTKKEKFSGIDCNGSIWIDGIVITKKENWNKRISLTKEQCMQAFKKEIVQKFLFDPCTFAPCVEGMAATKKMIKIKNVVIKKELNARSIFDENKLEELKKSILSKGLMYPITVKSIKLTEENINNFEIWKDGQKHPVPNDLIKDEEDIYVLIDGERRLRCYISLLKEGYPLKDIIATIENNEIGEIEEKFSGLDTNGIIWVDGIVVTKLEKWNKTYSLSKEDCMKMFKKEIFQQFLFDPETFIPYVEGMPDDCENLIK